MLGRVSVVLKPLSRLSKHMVKPVRHPRSTGALKLDDTPRIIRNPKLLASLEQSRRDIAEGRVRRFTTVDELIADLNRE